MPDIDPALAAEISRDVQSRESLLRRVEMLERFLRDTSEYLHAQAKEFWNHKGGWDGLAYRIETRAQGIDTLLAGTPAGRDVLEELTALKVKWDSLSAVNSRWHELSIQAVGGLHQCVIFGTSDAALGGGKEAGGG